MISDYLNVTVRKFDYCCDLFVMLHLVLATICSSFVTCLHFFAFRPVFGEHCCKYSVFYAEQLHVLITG
jgi:hypothetical protein